MTSTLLTILLWVCALGCGLLGGLYFAFSAFIMNALDRTGQASGIAAMNSINAVILRSWFMPVFFGTTLGAAALAVVGVLHREAGGNFMLAGGVVYVLGMFVVTMAANVPLNNALMKVSGTSAGAASVWQRYLKTWTRWNHLRTLASMVGSAMFIAALVKMGTFLISL